MYIQRRFPLIGGLRWTFAVIPAMGLWAGLITFANENGLPWLRLPTLPVTVLGTAAKYGGELTSSFLR